MGTIPPDEPNAQSEVQTDSSREDRPFQVRPLPIEWLVIGAIAAGVAILTYFDPKAGAPVLIFLTVAGGLYVLLRK